jgi:uncharacterized protein (TIGR02246 family)
MWKTGMAMAALMLAAAPAWAASPDDAALNGLYEAMARGAATASADMIAGAFADDALLLYPDNQPAMDGTAFRASLGQMAASLKPGQLDSRFRIERRLVSDGLAVDNGVLRRTMRRADGREQTSYAKFVVASRRDADGRWRVVTDASLPANEDAWTRVQRTPGLKYDE